MNKNEKRLCWNCDADVSLHLEKCPYCGVDLNQPITVDTPFQGLGDPFQKAPTQEKAPFSISQDEWEKVLDEKEEEVEEPSEKASRKEAIALFLLLPGVVFCLFGLLLLLFSDDGTLTLRWNQNLAYFYFLGAIPLIFLGWHAINRNTTPEK